MLVVVPERLNLSVKCLSARGMFVASTISTPCCPQRKLLPRRSLLRWKVDSLTQANDGLMIQNDILEHDVSDCDKILEEARAEVEVVRHD